MEKTPDVTTELESPLTDWGRIKKAAGPNPEFPGKRVYLFCHVDRLSAYKPAGDTGQWLRQFRSEAEAQGLTVEVQGSHLYVLIPEG
jgi:hypothetical protein